MFTPKQGQYLAFIYWYTKVNRKAPAEADIQRHFGVSAPSVHQMILTLEAAGHLERIPGLSRSLKVLLPFHQLPELE
ncbi:MAG TPA: helix-turn-helix domain-containing protein [Burkholderiaceae bacterium]|nr:helix-turn-helix domain-containing protein [Burkholderiaceae bacterium]